MKIIKLILLTIFLLSTSAFSQIRVVVADFKNESDVFFLDSWERKVPDLLRAELSRSKDITILERQKMDAIFEEQKLALAGFVNDSALVKQIGNLVGAEVILSGSIYKVGKKYRIDVNITRVKTTRVITEKAEAPDAKHLNDMVDILANNIDFQLTGKNKYIEQKKIADYPTKYFLAATGGFLLAAVLTNGQYQKNLDLYNQNTDLDKFDSFYDKANNAKKLTVLLGSLGAVAIMGSLYCWIGNMTGGAVRAHRQKEIQLTPDVSWLPGEGGRLSVQISF